MKKYQVKITDKALADMTDIYNYMGGYDYFFLVVLTFAVVLLYIPSQKNTPKAISEKLRLVSCAILSPANTTSV